MVRPHGPQAQRANREAAAKRRTGKGSCMFVGRQERPAARSPRKRAGKHVAALMVSRAARVVQSKDPHVESGANGKSNGV